MEIDDALNGIMRLKAGLDADIPPMDWLDKRLLSRLYKRRVIHEGWQSREPGEKAVVDSKAFVVSVLPFSNPVFESQNAQLDEVDPSRVLAGKYRDMLPSSLGNDIEEADALNHASRTNGDNAATYMQIGNFSLYAVSEGKNRVELFKRLKRPIAARVCKSPYPPAEHLELFKIKPFGQVGLRYIGGVPPARVNRLELLQSSSKYEVVLPFH